MSINEPHWIELYACITAPWGGITIGLTVDEAAEWDRDPDAYAARYLGITIPQYEEWLKCRGYPLCAAHTKKGRLCKFNVLGTHHGDLKVFLALHRNGYCAIHGGEKTP